MSSALLVENSHSNSNCQDEEEIKQFSHLPLRDPSSLAVTTSKEMLVVRDSTTVGSTEGRTEGEKPKLI